jgi:hypothetical protein
LRIGQLTDPDQPRTGKQQQTEDDQHHLPWNRLDELDLGSKQLDAGACDPGDDEDDAKADEKGTHGISGGCGGRLQLERLAKLDAPNAAIAT